AWSRKVSCKPFFSRFLGGQAQPSYTKRTWVQTVVQTSSLTDKGHALFHPKNPPSASSNTRHPTHPRLGLGANPHLSHVCQIRGTQLSHARNPDFSTFPSS
ncbi:hypothetical protein TorRG33x02_339290, partial [Trema orientale]